MKRSHLEMEFEFAWWSLTNRSANYAFVPEYRFHDTRKWKFDFAHPKAKVAVEIEGGTWGKSRHTTHDGYSRDCEKYNAAQRAGWLVIRLTSTMIVVDQLERIINDIKIRTGLTV